MTKYPLSLGLRIGGPLRSMCGWQLIDSFASRSYVSLGDVMNVLFVCTSNRLRSPTAETLFTGWPGLEVSSAGLDPAATRLIDQDLIATADVIFVMERHHGTRSGNVFARSLVSSLSTCSAFPIDTSATSLN